MSERWRNYFEDKTSGQSIIKYAYEHWEFLMPAYRYVLKFAPPPARILDVGCGLGMTGVFLEANGYEFTGIDNEEAVIKKARNVCDFFHSSITLETGDAFNLKKYHGKFDVTVSFGVVEHFDRRATIDLLKQQAMCSPLVLAVIPTKYSGDPITDERLYSMKQFKKIFREAGLEPVKAFTLGNPARSKQLQDFLPGIVYHLSKKIFTYAPGIGIIGKRF